MMRRSMFLLVFTVLLGVAFALSGDGDAKSTKSTTTKKEAKSCCMPGAKAERSTDQTTKGSEPMAAMPAKHAGNKEGEGHGAKMENCCEHMEGNEGCCSKASTETKVEKPAEKPLR